MITGSRSRQTTPRWIATLTLSIMGCVDWRGAVTRQAARDHACEQVTVVSYENDIYAGPVPRSVELQVCGRRRLYHDIGDDTWVDMTDGAP